MSSGPSRSRPDDFGAAIDSVASRILDTVRGSVVMTVLVDGRSGSGKSTLARRLVGLWPTPVQVVALDDLYPGWDGLDAGVTEMLRRVLEPRSRGETAVFRGWDWGDATWGDERSVSSDVPLIIEGSGALRPETRPYADIAVWLDSPTASRRDRAMARDGELYRPHWDRWASQEARHIERDGPRALADLVGEIP